MEDKINYQDVYHNSIIRISYKADDGYEKLCTGRILKEDDTNIVVASTFNEEVVMIRKSMIGSARTYLGGKKDVRQQD